MKDKKNKKEKKKDKKKKGVITEVDKQIETPLVTTPKLETKEIKIPEIQEPELPKSQTIVKEVKKSSAVEKWKRKLETERKLEKELEEESKLHEDILPKLRVKELEESEYITCPKCKQLTVVIEHKCSVCNYEITPQGFEILHQEMGYNASLNLHKAP